MAILYVMLFLAQQVLSPVPLLAPDSIGALPVDSSIEQNGEGVIRGVVRRADTRETLRNAVIHLSTEPLPGGPPRSLNAISDALGKFEFKNLPFQTYTVTVGLESYFAPDSNGNPLTSAAVRENLDALRRTADLTVELTPPATIFGVVLDADGIPVVNAPVDALRLTYKKGHRALSAVKSVATDDRGMFRLNGLPPAEYYIRAAIPATPVDLDLPSTISLRAFGLRSPGVPGAALGLSNSFTPMYAPGDSDPQRAVSLKVRGGDEHRADIQFLKSLPVRISGTAVSAVDGSPQPPLGFFLIPRNTDFDEGLTSILLKNVAADPSKGHFEVVVTRPGSYDLVAFARHDLRTTDSSGRTIVRGGYLSGRSPIEVADKDIGNLQVSVGPGQDLEIRFSGPGATSIRSKGIGYVLRSRDAMDSTPLVSETGAIMNPDGRFYTTVRFDPTLKFSNLPDGQYQIELPFRPVNTYVSDMRQGGRSVLNDGVFTVGQTSAEPVEVVLNPDGVSVSGKIVVGGVTAMGRVRLALAPMGPRRENPLFYVRGQSFDGTFRLDGIAPGEYKLYAFDVLPVGADENPAFLTEFEQFGRTLLLRENSAITDITLPLIHTR